MNTTLAEAYFDTLAGSYDAATAYLTSNRTTGRIRRLARRTRANFIPGSQVPKPEPVKLVAKLARLPLVKLHRRLHQAARRAAQAKYLLAKLGEVSAFRPAVQAEQDRQILLANQINAELKTRALRAEGKL